MKGRMVFRVNRMKNKETLQIYRCGFHTMWEYAKDHLLKWGIPKAGSWNPKNQMGGDMWATPAEYAKKPLSGFRCARILELAYERGCSWDKIKLMRKTCSYLYCLKKGHSGKNFSEVNGMMKSLDPKGCAPPSKSMIPTKIINPDQLKVAFTTEWNPEGNMSLVEFVQGSLSTYDYDVLGLRSVSDLTKIKESETHHWDPENKCWSTAYLGGRSKLAMHKAGTVPWRAWRICLCPGNVHVSPPEDFEFTIKPDGNPMEPLPENICTTCPYFAGELLSRLQFPRNFRCYKKWTKKGFQKTNHGDILGLSHRWLVEQGITTENEPFDPNSGRKALGLWLERVDAKYNESVHIHGDLEDVFRKHYQASLAPYGSEIRAQSLNFAVATAALVKLRRFFERHAPPEPLPSNLSQDSQVLLSIAQKVGSYQQALDIYKAQD